MFGSAVSTEERISTSNIALGRQVDTSIITIQGKFFAEGDRRFWVRGVTYGAFAPDADGNEYWNTIQIERDFAQMVEYGINTVRIPHTMPSRSLLDIAQRHGLRVIVGLSAEQYVGYLIEGRLPEGFDANFRAKFRQCARHPAVLCIALGNEIPAAQVRLIGARPVERYLRRLFGLVKAEDPDALVSYVNYPSTEYLDLPFLDVVSINVYLEQRADFEAYLARLQNLAGDRPLLLTELGLDAMRNGEEAQARALDWQIRATFASGAAGAVIFSWTDEWFRGGGEVDDWAFGITDRERRPKAAALAAQRAFAEVPFPRHVRWPFISVIVCSYNGAATIGECLDRIVTLDYPNYEVIVVDDGSTDGTGEIAAQYRVHQITQANCGLSAARNIGLAASRGEVVAYIDDDAYPDSDWLRYLGAAFLRSTHAAIGGPNLPPPKDGDVAIAVSRSPGSPNHVLIDDEMAEHIPGCNMAFRRETLLGIRGFDSQFRTAGDDVDVCWRLQQRGGTIGFCAAAVVYHHRRGSIRAFWRQQSGYGRAEALLAAKWPEKYNLLGHVSWAGRIYACGPVLPWLFSQRIYHGVFGAAPFQSLQRGQPIPILSLPLMPEWYLVVGALGVLSMLGLQWRPLDLALLLFLLALSLPIGDAMLSATRARSGRSGPRERYLWWLTVLLTTIQPLARLHGRLRHGLIPWRRRSKFGFAWPSRRSFALWSDTWHPSEEWLTLIRRHLTNRGARIVDGNAYDRWDIAVVEGLVGGARLLTAIEDHGSGTQYVRTVISPYFSKFALGLGGILGVLGILAERDSAWLVTATCLLACALIIGRIGYEAAAGTAALRSAVSALAPRAGRDPAASLECNPAE